MINYDNKVFVSVTNTDNGEVSSETVFHYKQEGNIVHVTYRGGNIKYGTLVETVNDQRVLYFRYNHVNIDNQLRGGGCISTLELLPDGRVRLYERWKWTDKEASEGESIIEELTNVLHTI
jgi:hypothetical protein